MLELYLVSVADSPIQAMNQSLQAFVPLANVAQVVFGERLLIDFLPDQFAMPGKLSQSVSARRQFGQSAQCLEQADDD